MADDQPSKELALSLPGEWVLRKTLGPTFDQIGIDLQKLYSAGRDRVVEAASRKIKDIEDGKQANLRVTRDVFWNGAFTDEEICAEYFGGILAASRSDDGRDDAPMPFLESIKSLSSAQLRLHYLIYRCLNLDSVRNHRGLNVGQESEVSEREIWFPALRLEQDYKIRPETDGMVLFREGLITTMIVDLIKVEGGRSLPYLRIKPCSYGILLYSAGHNRLNEWREFSKADFGRFEGIEDPAWAATNQADLLKKLELRERSSD